jgi:Zn-dependent metalloprotease
MVYGPGYAGALDIVAHEMTHGIIAHEKNLLYLNEPGAVNESLADIFGALIEYDARGDGGNWLIGEASPGFSITAPLRSLADPNLRDANGKSMFDRNARFSLANRGQPDHYSEVLTPDDQQCGSTAYQDNGCVHFNSGILNKFAYLISEGGLHRGVTVTGIGRYKLGRITYRAMTVGLNQSSTLGHAANAFVESCFELASAELGGIIPSDCEQVLAAQKAVGLEVPAS